MLTVILMAGLGFFLFWQRNGWAALLGMAVFAVCAVEVDRLVHSEYVVTDDGHLMVRHGRLARGKVIPITDIVEVKEEKMRWGMGHYVLVRYGANRYVTMQPSNTHSLADTLKHRMETLADNDLEQTKS